MVTPDFAEFKKMAATGNIVPVYREILGEPVEEITQPIEEEPAIV